MENSIRILEGTCTCSNAETPELTKEKLQEFIDKLKEFTDKGRQAGDFMKSSFWDLKLPAFEFPEEEKDSLKYRYRHMIGLREMGPMYPAWFSLGAHFGADYSWYCPSCEKGFDGPLERVRFIKNTTILIKHDMSRKFIKAGSVVTLCKDCSLPPMFKRRAVRI